MNGELKEFAHQLRLLCPSDVDDYDAIHFSICVIATDMEAIAAHPTPAPGALPEFPAASEYVARLCRIFSDHPYDDTSVMVLRDYARAYAEQCRAGVVVTDAMVERSARKVCEIAMQDWDDIGPFAQSVLMDTQRAALQSAFADDEGVA